MPVFRLEPINNDDPIWARSTYKGPCLILAATSDAARDLATAEFLNPVRQKLLLQVPASPWEKSELVKCVEVSDENTDLPLDTKGVVFIVLSPHQ